MPSITTSCFPKMQRESTFRESGYEDHVLQMRSEGCSAVSGEGAEDSRQKTHVLRLHARIGPSKPPSVGPEMIKVTKDGRTIRSGKDYTEFRKLVFHEQKGRCFTCGAWTNLEAPFEAAGSFHLNHLNGRRGLGGSKRNDVIIDHKGIRQVQGDCGDCHRKYHNQGCSGSLQFGSGQYVP